jgi:hypothetical protein
MHVGDLPELRVLLVERNRLEDVGTPLLRAAKLERLELGGNQLESLPATAAPDSSIKTPVDAPLQQLRTLGLSYNRLAALPAWVSSLGSLGSLDLTRNALDEIPSLAACRALRVLRLAHNRLVSLPELHPACVLAELTATHNRLADVPATWARALSRLVDIDLSANALAQIPTVLGELPRCRRLRVARNAHISTLRCGSLPRGLVALDASHTAVSGVPAAMRARTPGLQRLMLTGCPLLPEHREGGPGRATAQAGVTTTLRDAAAAIVAAHRAELVGTEEAEILEASGLLQLVDEARVCGMCGGTFAGAGTRAVQFCPVGGLRVPVVYELCSYTCRARANLGFGVSQRRSIGVRGDDHETGPFGNPAASSAVPMNVE